MNTPNRAKVVNLHECGIILHIYALDEAIPPERVDPQLDMRRRKAARVAGMEYDSSFRLDLHFHVP